MVKLPPNCKINYFNDKVNVKMTYATSLPEGVYDNMTVFSNWKGRRYITFEYDVKYQNNLPMLIKDMYFQTKKKAMLFNRKKKQEHIQKEMDLLSRSDFAGLWDLMVLNHNSKLPPPPDEIYIPI